MLRFGSTSLMITLATSFSCLAQGFGQQFDIGVRSMDQVMIEAMKMKKDDKLRGMLNHIPRSQHEAFHRAVISRWSTELGASDWDQLVLNITKGEPPAIGSLGSSPFEQPISPIAATGTFGSGSVAGSAWRSSVEKSEAEKSENGLLTCEAALGMLKTFACGEDTQCDIEKAYERKCWDEIDRNDTKTYAQCATVEHDYVASCFSGETFEEYLQTFGTSTGTVLSDDILCNAAAFEMKGVPYGATAKHCLKGDNFMHSSLYKGSMVHPKPHEMHLSSNPPFHTDGDLAIMDVYDLRFKHPILLKAAAPETFAPTIFIAINRFSYLRHKLAIKFRKSEDQGSYYLVDQSPLCTVVSYDRSTGEITHTCQSSRGSSGGALIQKVNDRLSLVGIHVGYDDGNNNISNMAQFAPAHVFE